jgi:uncharacterized protein (TIGR02145 family)
MPKMKRAIPTSIFVFNIIIMLLAISCQKDKPGTETIEITKEKITGSVQKGPYISGTNILMSELNSSLGQTGKIFTTTILDNSGSFEIDNIKLNFGIMEFSANGFYFDEVKGELSTAQLALNALVDVSDISSVNVNIMTHLEKLRVQYLLVSQNKLFPEAKKMAQTEILAIFGFSPVNMNSSENLDISVNTESNAILLAISVLCQGNRSVASLSELLANISNDIQKDGILNNEVIIADLRSIAISLDLNKIRSNLEKRYQEIGINASIPQFEKYINDFLVQTAQAPESSVLTATDISGTGATLNGTVNPNSLSTAVTFQYGIADAFGNSIEAMQSPVTGSLPANVSVVLTGLIPETTYIFRVKAENAIGISVSSELTFTTSGHAPAAATMAALNIGPTSASLQAKVNPNSLSTDISFEYGTTPDYGNTVSCSQSPLISDTLENVSADITGLIPMEIYHFRIKAVNSVGTVYGEDLSFTTTPDGQAGTLMDIEGNIYNTIGIGKQLWMAENLKTSTLNNGSPLQALITRDSFAYNLTLPSIYKYANDPNPSESVYGGLYNWYAVSSGKLCPSGWHVPTHDEWLELANFLGGIDIAGGKLKEAGSSHWNSPNNGATDEAGFTALPGGIIPEFSTPIIGRGDIGYWWASAPQFPGTNETWFIHYTQKSINQDVSQDSGGNSVRCLKD